MQTVIQFRRGQYRITRFGGTQRLAADYGEIIGTKGADGEPIDVYQGLFPDADTAFIVNQYRPDGVFDEHKVMLHFYDQEQAAHAYALTTGKPPTNIYPCTLQQLDWWLQFGNHKTPVTPQSFPFDSENMMQEQTHDWTNENQAAAKWLYAQRNDDPYGTLTEAATLDCIMQDELEDGAEIEEAVYDALAVANKRLERTAKLLGAAFNRASGSLKVVENGIQISAPMKKNGTTNVAVMFEMTDGQTVSVLLHNPDTTPAKITPDDVLISWKWLLNRKDITIVVAKENGKDLPLPTVARRVMALVEKNTARFAKANANKAAETELLAQLEAEKTAKIARLEELNRLVAEKAGQPENSEINPDTLPTHLDENQTDLREAVSQYIKQNLQGKWISTQIGKVLFNAVSAGELKLGTKNNDLRAKLIPHVPQTLKKGDYLGRSELTKGRKDRFVAFHTFEDTAQIDGQAVRHRVKVGERDTGEFVFIAYHSRGVFDDAKGIVFAPDTVSNNKAGRSEAHAIPLSQTIPASNMRVNAALDDIEDDADGWNIEIISVNEQPETETATPDVGMSPDTVMELQNKYARDTFVTDELENLLGENEDGDTLDDKTIIDDELAAELNDKQKAVLLGRTAAFARALVLIEKVCNQGDYIVEFGNFEHTRSKGLFDGLRDYTQGYGIVAQIMDMNLFDRENVMRVDVDSQGRCVVFKHASGTETLQKQRTAYKNIKDWLDKTSASMTNEIEEKKQVEQTGQPENQDNIQYTDIVEAAKKLGYEPKLDNYGNDNFMQIEIPHYFNDRGEIVYYAEFLDNHFDNCRIHYPDAKKETFNDPMDGLQVFHKYVQTIKTAEPQKEGQPENNNFYAYEIKPYGNDGYYIAEFIGGFAEELKNGNQTAIQKGEQKVKALAEYIINLHQNNRIGETWLSANGQAEVNRIIELPRNTDSVFQYAVKYENGREDYTYDIDVLKQKDIAAVESLKHLESERPKIENSLNEWLAQSHLNKMQAGKARSTLSTKQDFAGFGIMSRAEFIYQRIAEGWTAEHRWGKANLFAPDENQHFNISETEKRFADWLIAQGLPETNSTQPTDRAFLQNLIDGKENTADEAVIDRALTLAEQHATDPDWQDLIEQAAEALAKAGIADTDDLAQGE